MADMMSDDSTELPVPMKVEQEEIETKGEKEEVAVPAIDVEPSKPPSTSVWIKGTIAMWKKTHGFINYGKDDGERIFCHQANVITSDKKVLLRRGMEVRFLIADGDAKDDRTCAVEVSARDGSPLSFHKKHGANDTYDREIEFEGEVFKGTVKFFSRFRSYGRISVNEETVQRLNDLGCTEKDATDLYFKENDLNIVAYPAKINRGDEVCFQIFNSSRGWGAMNIKTASGDLIPQFTEEDRAEKRSQKDTDDYNREEKPKRRRRQKSEKTQKEAVEVDFSKFEDVPETRFEGTVLSYNVHRFGFIEPTDAEELKKFGVLKNERLSFRAFDIETDQRPAMIDNDTKAKFTLERQEKTGVLYANEIRTVNEEKIVAERKYEAPEPRELLNADEWIEGTVFFFNWRRGHGRIQVDGEEEKYYFHRDDVRSNDKVPGVEDGMKVICQRAKDSKGASVTNIMNVDKTNFEGQLPKYFKNQN